MNKTELAADAISKLVEYSKAIGNTPENFFQKMQGGFESELSLVLGAIDVATEHSEVIKEALSTKNVFASSCCTVEEILARNIAAWETSKDKSQGLLPEVYLLDRTMFRKLTGLEPTWRNLKKYAPGLGDKCSF